MVRGTNCAWEEGPLTYRRRQAININTLSIDEKNHLANLINEGKVTASALSKHYSIDRKYLNNFGKQA